MNNIYYLFTALEVPRKQVREWDKQTQSEILNITAAGGRRDMALPCLAQLRLLVCWCNPAYDARWKDIELSLMDIPIQSVLGCLNRFNEVLQLQNQWLFFFLFVLMNIWLEVKKISALQRDQAPGLAGVRTTLPPSFTGP